MKSLGQAGSGMPRAKAGVHEQALSLLASIADPKATKKSLIDLRDATAAYDKAREAAEAAERKVAERESAAQAAEADAIRARQALADETEKARDELGKRFRAVTERERLADAREAVQEARAENLSHREKLLREAGVAGF